MHAITASLVGTVVSEVRFTTSADTPRARFRMVCQPRKYDPASGSFVDLDASFVTVVAWRALAVNLRDSVTKGDAVVVVGRLRVREWEHDGRSGVAVEVDAQGVGHDLARGTTKFTRAARSAEIPKLDARPERSRSSARGVAAADTVEPVGPPAAA